MRVNREDLLRSLDAVSPGLSNNEMIDQSSCFVFRGGLVQTFNDEIACSISSPLTIEGAIQAGPFQALLQKLAEQEIDLELLNGELVAKGKGRKAGFRCEKEIRLPVDAVEKCENWKPLSEDFTEAIDICKNSASKNESEFILTCIHIGPDFVEACDKYQLTRYMLNTGLESKILVRADSVKHLIGLDMTEFTETEAWIHFRNPAGLIYSCRRYIDNYPDLTNLLEVSGTKTVLPPGLVEAIDKAQIFSSEEGSSNRNQVNISLKPGKLMLKGQGLSGWYQEQKTTTYDGEPMSFVISPKLLSEILKKTHECLISPGRLVIAEGRFTYVGCLGQSA